MRLRTCACTETSSAEVGSSQTRNSGSVASARAIEMRWRWPPENWCGNFSPSAGDRPTDSQQLADALASTLGVSRRSSCSRSGSATMSLDLPARVQAGVRDPGRSSACAGAARWPRSQRGAMSRRRSARAARRRVAGRRAAAPPCSCRSPTRRRAPSVVPRCDREGDVVDRVHELARLALDDAVQPGRRDVEDLGQVAHLDQRPASHAAMPACRARAASSAARVAPASSRSGRSTRQRSNACGQRGLKAQPAGSRSAAASSRRSASSRRAVLVHRRDRAHQPGGVGMRAAWITASTGPISTMRPAYITATRSAGLGDHAHVVRDQHHRRAVLAAQALQQRDDLRLDRHVERRRRLVGDDQLGLGGRAPARSRRAGACRPRTGAGTGRSAASAAGMPISFSSAMARARAPRGSDGRCVRIVSTSCRPTV